jgi:hypothetical protein
MKSYKSKLLKILIIAILNLSINFENPRSILNTEDIELELSEENQKPALSSGNLSEQKWESFNTWICFPTDQIQLFCAEIDDSNDFVPTIEIYDFEGRNIQLSLDPPFHKTCNQILTEWTLLIKNKRHFCAFTAFLQNLELDDSKEQHPTELWIVDTLKTQSGYWQVD